MTRNNDDRSENEDELLPGYDADPMKGTQRREPKFGSFDDDEDEYEEPDRDTDYTGGFRTDGAEEEFESEFYDEDAPDLLPAADSTLRYEIDPADAEDPDAWLEDESYQDDHEDSESKWPLGLIAVAIVALVLLAAGGYGVMQQRAATEAELRDLRAALATAGSGENVSASRDALQNLQQSHDKLSANAEALTLENRRLTDTVAGLQAQLGVQQAVLTKPLPGSDKVMPAGTGEAALTPPVAPQPAAPQPVAPKPTAATPASPTTAIKAPVNTVATTAAAGGPWFVNFGSYASRTMAQTWATKLRPDAGKVIVAPNTKDGQTLYRVRVVGLASRSAAQEVARQLETQLRVSALWVGKE